MIETTPHTNPATHTVKGDHGLFARCPDCDGRDFLIQGVGAVLFACLTCDSRWRCSLGYVWRVDHGRRSATGTVTA